ncbi:ferredoxin [Halobellus sp. Atlit-38R]|uniref:ferredoxin Fer n=1 Tax=Halobellus sp. Atlit-38R TaxID=2282131 RepID=UPI000EF20B6F|nr:ferredoxin Fer [Halobellus sp. Atlit-38R]RLM89593.1 ferredoxin [Halobellus sp. Atlit-38R]
MESPYDVLGIDADADEDEVVRAYRRRVKDAHPDHGGSLAEFKRVRRAYEHITAGRDPSTFDAHLENGHADTAQSGGAGAADREREPGTSGTQPGASGAEEEEDDEDEELGPTVEYLDYEVVESQGWELTDKDLFEKAEAADLGVDSHGLLVVEPQETLLEAAERYGFSWPYACRGGACANCAVAVVEGELEMPVSTVLTDEMKEQGIRLSCIGEPVTDDLKVVFNIERLPGLAELRLPAEQFDNARAGD